MNFTQTGPQLRAITAYRIHTPPTLRSSHQLKCGAVTVADAMLDLDEPCAPPFPVWAPKGLTLVQLERLEPFKATPAMADLVEKDLQQMLKASWSSLAKSPFVDFDHDAVSIAGQPQQFFWDDKAGIRLYMHWSEEAEQNIIGGYCHSFSPQWVAKCGRFIGLQANVGALLTNKCEPAFGRRMPPIRPITRGQRLLLTSDHYVRLVGQQADQLKPTDSGEKDIAGAARIVKARFPELAEAFEIKSELAKQFASRA